MNCNDVQECLELLALGETNGPLRARIEKHIERCEPCRDALEDLRLLVGGLRASGAQATIRPGFDRALRSSVASEISAQRRRRQARRACAAIAALAASVLVCAMLWRAWAGRGAAAARDLWRYDGVVSAMASPADRVVLHAGAMFVLRRVGRECYVAAIDMASGRPRWRSEVPCLGYLAADASRVFALASGGQGKLDLVALDAANGREAWRFSAQVRHRLEAPARPAPINGKRVCWAVGNRVCLLESSTGAVVWQWQNRGRSRVAVVGDGQKLYAVSGGRVQCLDAATGKATWAVALPAHMAGVKRPQAAIAGGRLYFVQTGRTRASRLVCMDLATRQVLWHRHARGALDLAVADDGVYLRGQEIAAFDCNTGAPLWSRAASGCGPLTLAGGMIHFVDSSKAGALVALDRRTGKEEWSLAGLRSCDALNTSGSMGYVKTQDGVVHAIRLAARRRS